MKSKTTEREVSPTYWSEWPSLKSVQIANAGEIMERKASIVGGHVIVNHTMESRGSSKELK